MSRICTAYFGAAVIYALGGMVLGIVMGATQDHSAMPLHAHMNLLGWASLGVMGAFYGVAGERTPVRLAWLNFTVSNVGNVMMLAMLWLIVQGKTPILAILVPGELLIVAGMLIFGLSVLTVARRPAAT